MLIGHVSDSIDLLRPINDIFESQICTFSQLGGRHPDKWQLYYYLADQALIFYFAFSTTLDSSFIY